MENDEALKVMNDIYDALFKAQVAIKYRQQYEKEILEVKNRITEKDKEIKELQKENRINNILVNGYKQHSNIKIEICPECNGDGGFSWDDGYGNCGGEPCQNCEQRGYLIK